jgi:hypothetical protein
MFDPRYVVRTSRVHYCMLCYSCSRRYSTATHVARRGHVGRVGCSLCMYECMYREAYRKSRLASTLCSVKAYRVHLTGIDTVSSVSYRAKKKLRPDPYVRFTIYCKSFHTPSSVVVNTRSFSNFNTTSTLRKIMKT